MEGGIRAAGVRPQSLWAGGVCVRARGGGNVHACTDGPQLLVHLTVHVCIIATLSMLTLPLNTCPLLGVPS